MDDDEDPDEFENMNGNQVAVKNIYRKMHVSENINDDDDIKG